MTETIGLRELRQHASRYVDAAEHGETIEITKHGRPVARLVPVAPDPDDPLARYIAEGIIKPAEEEGDLLDIIPIKPEHGTPSVTEELIRMREEERY